MGEHYSGNQVVGATVAQVSATLPAGATLQKARLSVTTWFSTNNSTGGVQGAPPNTVIAIGFVATGSGITQVTPSNFGGLEYYVGGYGEIEAIATENVYAPLTGTSFLWREHTYTSVLEKEMAIFNSASFDIGVTAGFQGSGFWDNLDVWLTWHLRYWYT